MVPCMRDKMRLCYIANAQSIHTQRLARHFASQGHQVFLLSYAPIPNGLEEENLTTFGLRGLALDNGRKTASFPWVEHQFDRVAYLLGLIYGLRLGFSFPAPVGSRPPFLPKRENKYILNLEACAQEARKIVKRIQPDVVHGHFLTGHGFVAARTGFKPLVASAWGSDVLLYPQNSLQMRMILRYVFRTADLLTSDAESLTRAMLEYGAKACKIVKFVWGVDTNTFHAAQGRSKIRELLDWSQNLILISTREFRPICGVEYFIEALPLIIHQKPLVRVILVGSGSLEEKIRKRVLELGLEEYVHFTGWLDRAVIPEYLNAADLYVSTSLSDSTSVSLLEAMACGLPVVVSDAPANLEWVKDGDNGYIIPRKKPGILAERIIALLANDSLQREMRARNLEIAKEKADWNKNLTVLANTYHKLCKTSRMPKGGPCVCC